jgi:hypothetical protein
MIARLLLSFLSMKANDRLFSEDHKSTRCSFINVSRETFPKRLMLIKCDLNLSNEILLVVFTPTYYYLFTQTTFDAAAFDNQGN